MTRDVILDILSQEYGGTTLMSWLVFLSVTLVAFMVLSTLRALATRSIVKRAKKAKTLTHDLIASLLRSVSSITLLSLSILVALRVEPSLPPNLVATLKTVLLVALYVQIGLWGNKLISTGLESGLTALDVNSNHAKSASGVIQFFSLLALWSGIVLLVMGTLGQPIAPLIAGFGIGGIVIAFALQKILGDIFCSVAIVLDNPFEVGDFIVLGEEMGTVERIGIKTTRVRSVGGELIVFANADLLDSRIRNFRRMEERRVVFNFGVAFHTPLELVEKIPSIVRSTVEGCQKTRFDRAHFKDFGASSINYEVAYFVLSSDYNEYMDIQQAINIGLMKTLQGSRIAFAFPTQAVYVVNSGNGSYLHGRNGADDDIGNAAGNGGESSSSSGNGSEPSDSAPEPVEAKSGDEP